MSTHVELQVGRILKILVQHEVKFVVIGGVAVQLHGSTLATLDLDVIYARDRQNISRVAAAVGDLQGQRRDVPRDVVAPVDERAILNSTNLLLITRYGQLDLIGETPAERWAYEDVAPTAQTVEVPDGRFLVVSRQNLIRMKRAAGRPKDLIGIEELGAIGDEEELREAAGRYVTRRPAAPRKGASTRPLSRRADRGRARPAKRGPSRTKAR